EPPGRPCPDLHPGAPADPAPIPPRSLIFVSEEATMIWVAVVAALVVGAGAGLAIRRFLATSRIQGAESRAQKLVLEAEREAETKVRAALVEVKDETASMRLEAEEDVRIRRQEVTKQQERLARREDQLDRQQSDL